MTHVHTCGKAPSCSVDARPHATQILMNQNRPPEWESEKLFIASENRPLFLQSAQQG